MKNNIEKEKIDYIIRNKARPLSNLVVFNKESMEFLKCIYNEYCNLTIQKDNNINDIHIYENILNTISNQAGDCYKISKDLEFAINKMKNGIYNPTDIEEIENDFIYIGFIINTNTI